MCAPKLSRPKDSHSSGDHHLPSASGGLPWHFHRPPRRTVPVGRSRSQEFRSYWPASGIVPQPGSILSIDHAALRLCPGFGNRAKTTARKFGAALRASRTPAPRLESRVFGSQQREMHPRARRCRPGRRRCPRTSVCSVSHCETPILYLAPVGEWAQSRRRTLAFGFGTIPREFRPPLGDCSGRSRRARRRIRFSDSPPARWNAAWRVHGRCELFCSGKFSRDNL